VGLPQLSGSQPTHLPRTWNPWGEMTQPHSRPAKRLVATQIADSLERSERVHDVASLGVSLCRGHVP
jgi:hypothetical protein